MPCSIYATQKKVVHPPSISDENSKKKDPLCFRPISLRIEPPFDGDSGSSSYVEIGKTKVVVTISGPKELLNNDYTEGVLNVSVHGVENVNSVRHTIKASLESVVCLKRLARTEVDVEISVIADDGGLIAASLMASGLALASANIEQFDILLACQLMIKEGIDSFIVDPDLDDIRAIGPSKTLVTVGIIPSLGQVVCLDVGGAPVSQDQLDLVMRFGYDRCLQLYPVVSKCLKNYLKSPSDDFE